MTIPIRPTPPTPPTPDPALPTPTPNPLSDRRIYTALSFAATSASLWAIQRYVTKPLDPQTQAIITAAVSAAVGYVTSHFLTRKGVS